MHQRTRRVLALAAIVSVFACNPGSKNGPGAGSVEQEPPKGLVVANFLRAPIVVQLRIHSIEMVDTLRADDGKIGYGTFRVAADVVAIYKSDRAMGREVTYFFTMEYEPDWHKSWRRGDRRLVFLAGLPERREFTVIDEAADFHMSPNLEEVVRELAPLQELVAHYDKLAAAESEVDWRELVRPLPQGIGPDEWPLALDAIESIQLQRNLSLTSSGCERWAAWQLARCRLELAAGRYVDAVRRHVDLGSLGLGCVDLQSLWWSLAVNCAKDLRERHQHDSLLVLLEAVEPTFPNGPARAMRAETARLRYRLGTLDWRSQIAGVLGEVTSANQSSHDRKFVTTKGDTLELHVDSSAIITRNGEVWDPEAGFVAKDADTPAANPERPVPNPLVAGAEATVYRDDLGNVVMIELGVGRERR